MALPATETIYGGMCYVSIDDTENINMVNDTGADLAIGDFAVINGIHPAIAKSAIVNGVSGPFDEDQESLVQTKNLEAGGDTFATLGQKVYWNATTKKFSDLATGGFYYVGRLIYVKDSGGVIVFRRNHVTRVNSIASGEYGVVSYEVAADATTAISKDFGFNFTIVDVWAVCTATNGAGTIKLQNTAAADITAAIACATVNVTARQALLVAATKVIADGKVKFIANGAADRGIVYLMVKGA